MPEKKDTFHFTPGLKINQDVIWDNILKRFEVKNSIRVKEGYRNSFEGGKLIYKIKNTKTNKICKYKWERTITKNNNIVAWVYVSLFAKVIHILIIINDEQNG